MILIINVPKMGRSSQERIRAADKSKNNGAGKGIRTLDLLITNQLLYQLSYPGITAMLIVYTLELLNLNIPAPG